MTLSHPTCDVIRLKNGPLVEFHDKATTSTKYVCCFCQTDVEVGPDPDVVDRNQATT
jgi:hypothetical protein